MNQKKQNWVLPSGSQPVFGCQPALRSSCLDHCHCPAPFTLLCLAKRVFSPVPPYRGYSKPSHFIVFMFIYLVSLINWLVICVPCNRLSIAIQYPPIHV